MLGAVRRAVCVAALMAAIMVGAGPVAAFAETQDEAAAPAYRNGDAALRLGHVRAAYDLFASGCVTGAAYDCYREGDLLRQGIGTDQDFDRAADRYARACDLSSADACLILANLYFQGRGVAEDFPTARIYYARGCDLNAAAACAVLGNMMYAGLGGARDRIAGADHLRRACLQDVDYACRQVRRYGLSNQGERSNTLRRGWWSGN
ncbi:MAG: tetratricopeptide repeat protein [Pseudomonadota bacterium]